MSDRIELTGEEVESVIAALVDASCAMPQVHPDRGRVLQAIGLLRGKAAPPAADPRIVYGARCSWWDSIEKASTTSAMACARGASGPTSSTISLPCCPHCASPLFEVESEAEWWAGVEKHERESEPSYRAFIEWLRGKCFGSLAEARLVYGRETSS